MGIPSFIIKGPIKMHVLINERPPEQTNNQHMRNKGTDQLRSNREADQRLCFRYMDSTIPLHVLSKSKISSL